jgi:mediator of RNA polymerase II transcription subunit 5
LLADDINATNMDLDPTTRSLRASVAKWSGFVRHALLKRLDPERFAAFTPIHFADHPLPPLLVADIVIRPTAPGKYSLDPRAFRYLEVLLKQGRVDTASVLRALCKYSSIHAWVRPPQDAAALPGDGIKKEEGVEEKKRQGIASYQNSYHIEEALLWRLAQAVHRGTGIKSAKNVTEVSKVLAKWMALFAEAAAAFSREAFGSLQSLRVRDEAERAKNALALFAFAFSENPVVLSVLSRPVCKGGQHFFLQSGLQEAELTVP